MTEEMTPFMEMANKTKLSVRALNVLKLAGVETFDDFMAFVPSNRYRYCSDRVAREIINTQKMYYVKPEQPSPEIDWEQRRYEIAKTVIHAQISAPIIPGVDPNPSITDLAKRSVMIADALVAELKKGGEK